MSRVEFLSPSVTVSNCLCVCVSSCATGGGKNLFCNNSSRFLAFAETEPGEKERAKRTEVVEQVEQVSKLLLFILYSMYPVQGCVCV